MFYSNTCSLVGLALLVNCSILTLVRVRRYAGPPKSLKRAFSGGLGKFLCLGNYYHQVSAEGRDLDLDTLL